MSEWEPGRAQTLSERLAELLSDNLTLPNYLQDYEIEAIREATALARRVEGACSAYIFSNAAPEPHQVSSVTADDDAVIDSLDGQRVALVPVEGGA